MFVIVIITMGRCGFNGCGPYGNSNCNSNGNSGYNGCNSNNNYSYGHDGDSCNSNLAASRNDVNSYRKETFYQNEDCYSASDATRCDNNQYDSCNAWNGECSNNQCDGGYTGYNNCNNNGYGGWCGFNGFNGYNGCNPSFRLHRNLGYGCGNRSGFY